MTSYVLGAGASVHAGYPLCSNLWTGMSNWVNSSDCANKSFQQTIQTIADLGGPGLDIEAFFTDLSLGQGIYAAYDSAERSYLLKDIRICLKAWFTHISKLKLDADRYAALASKLVLGDAIVTFNYDFAFEIELIRVHKFRVRDGYGFDANWDESRSDVKLLKLHGSADWIGEISGPRPGSFSASLPRLLGPYVDNRDSHLPGYESAVLDRTYSGRGGDVDSAIAMILPTRAKRFAVSTSFVEEWGEFYAELWKNAADKITKASRLVIIGYSMPEADADARRLLLETSNKEAALTVCCCGATAGVEQQFRNAGFRNIHRITNPTFEGYLSHEAEARDGG